MSLRTSDRTKLALASLVFAGAVVIAVLRAGVLSHVGSLRLGAPAAMNDFYSSVYYPVRAFLDGENPHDPVRLKELYPKVEAYPPYLPFNLVLHLPFGLLSPGTAAAAYFGMAAVLTIPLGWVALRLAHIVPNLWRAILVAGLLLLTRPGHWALISGQHTVVLVLLAYVALWQGRRSPLVGGVALAVCMYKPTHGIPLALLMLAADYGRATWIGVLMAAAVNVPLVLVLAGRAGGLRPFLEKLVDSYHSWQQLPGMDPGTSLDPMSFNQLGIVSFLSRLVGHNLSPQLSLGLSVFVLAMAAATLRRLRHPNSDELDDLSLGVLCLGTLVSLYHMTYDFALLTASLVALAVHGAPRPAPRWMTGVLTLLFLVPCVNWALTASVLESWRPPHGLWIGIASVNGACLLLLFASYVGVAWAVPPARTGWREPGEDSPPFR